MGRGDGSGRYAPAIVQILNKEFNTALAAPDIRERIHSLLLEPAGGRPEDRVKDEHLKYSLKMTTRETFECAC